MYVYIHVVLLVIIAFDRWSLQIIRRANYVDMEVSLPGQPRLGADALRGQPEHGGSARVSLIAERLTDHHHKDHHICEYIHIYTYIDIFSEMSIIYQSVFNCQWESVQSAVRTMMWVSCLLGRASGPMPGPLSVQCRASIGPARHQTSVKRRGLPEMRGMCQQSCERAFGIPRSDHSDVALFTGRGEAESDRCGPRRRSAS